MIRVGALALVGTALLALPLAAQLPAASPLAAPPAGPAPRARANWLSDRIPLRVGDVVTVVLDERTNANERASTSANNSRSNNLSTGDGVDPANVLGPVNVFRSTVNNASQEGGQLNRAGDLSGVITARVTRIDANGLATIEGAKSVSVDGRQQEIHLAGLVRPDDITADNLVASSRVADAVISYKGKKFAAKQGIFGKILSILWP